MKAITVLVVLAVVALANAALAATQAVTLLAHNQRTPSGTRNTLVWKDCGATSNHLPPCIQDPPSQWSIDNNVVGSDATWTWNSETGVLTGTGLYGATSYINSGPDGTPIVSDKVRDLVIDTTNKTTDATSYECIEGAFLGGVNANGCKYTNLGLNSVDESVASWNVGDSPKCVTLQIGGDDYSLLDGQANPYARGTPVPHGLTSQTDGQAGVGCSQTRGSYGPQGAFDLWIVVQDDLSAGGTLILSNGVPVLTCTLPVDMSCAGANWMTFSTAAVPVPPVGWVLGPAFGVFGWFRRRPAPRT